MFSLCIPTMDRFDNFLSKNLPKYIENDLILEIIIHDENGNDVKKIKESNLNLDKIKLFTNDERLGPFLNKLEACKKAQNKWIALIDSDNFAPKEYFETAKKYLIEKNCNDLTILAPSWAKPNFDYRKLEGFIYKRNNFNKNRAEEIIKGSNSECCMNTGNYIINKNLIQIINLNEEKENIKKSSACDVIYFNTLLFEQTDMELHIVKDMHYDHVIHDGSIYLTTCNNYKKFNNFIYNKFKKLK